MISKIGGTGTITDNRISTGQVNTTIKIDKSKKEDGNRVNDQRADIGIITDRRGHKGEMEIFSRDMREARIKDKQEQTRGRARAIGPKSQQETSDKEAETPP